MDTVQALRFFDPQSLEPDQLQHAVSILGEAALRVKARSLLQPAFAAEAPGFQTFGRAAIQRLASLHQCVYNVSDGLVSAERTKTLRELDITSFIVCGLCLSKKSLARLDKTLFEEIVRQARGSSHRLVNSIIASSEIGEFVRRSGDEVFKQYLEQLLQLQRGVQRPETTLLLAGLPSWYYSSPSRRTIVFRQLVAFAIGGAVSTYIPIRPEHADCLVRLVINFNEGLLKALFDVNNQEYSAEHFHLHSAFKDQIAVVFGDDVLEAIQTSQQYSLDAEDERTTCVAADIYAGHCIIMSITMGRKECINFVNSAYGL